MTNADLMLGLIQKVALKEILRKMKFGKAAGPSEINTKMIVARGKIGAEIMVKLRLRDLDEKGIPDE